MTSMIERVARAIAERQGDEWNAIPKDKPDWTANRGMFDGRPRDINEPFQCDYLDMADAAIIAMREPTKAMIEAADEEAFAPDFRIEWQAAIDAALKEQP